MQRFAVGGSTYFGVRGVGRSRIFAPAKANSRRDGSGGLSPTRGGESQQVKRSEKGSLRVHAEILRCPREIVIREDGGIVELAMRRHQMRKKEKFRQTLAAERKAFLKRGRKLMDLSLELPVVSESLHMSIINSATLLQATSSSDQ